MPDTGRHGAFTSSEEMLQTLHSMAVTIGVIDEKLDNLAKSDARMDTEVENLKKDLDTVKARLYTMSGVISIGVAVATNWITTQING